jgi:hypothetical protein
MRTLSLFLFFGRFVQLRKPDVEMVRLAADIALAPGQYVVDIAFPMFARHAQSFGFSKHPYTDCKDTCSKPASLNLLNYNL